jgi:hypothetical protein
MRRSGVRPRVAIVALLAAGLAGTAAPAFAAGCTLNDFAGRWRFVATTPGLGKVRLVCTVTQGEDEAAVDCRRGKKARGKRLSGRLQAEADGWVLAHLDGPGVPFRARALIARCSDDGREVIGKAGPALGWSLLSGPFRAVRLDSETAPQPVAGRKS